MAQRFHLKTLDFDPERNEVAVEVHLLGEEDTNRGVLILTLKSWEVWIASMLMASTRFPGLINVTHEGSELVTQHPFWTTAP